MRGRPRKQEKAHKFLKAYLSNGRKPAPRPGVQLGGFSYATLNRVKESAGVVSEFDGFVWYWRLNSRKE